MPFTSALHLRPPFRADHVGSLLRPSALYEKRYLFKEGKCSAEELKLAEDEAIRDAVDLQRKAGMKTITDGEFRRRVFFCNLVTFLLATNRLMSVSSDLQRHVF